MNADTEIDLDAVHDAMIAAIAAQFPVFVTVETYRTDQKSLPTPAALISLIDMEPSPENDPGTEQLAVWVNWEVDIVISFKTAEAKRAVRNLVAGVAAFIHHNRFGQPMGPAEITDITPNDFVPEQDQYEIWSIEWRHLTHIGQTVWTDDGTIPQTVLASWVPLIGIDHEADYVEVVEAPEE